MGKSKTGRKADSKIAKGKLAVVLPNGSIESQLKFIASQTVKNPSSQARLIEAFVEKHRVDSDVTVREKIIVSVLVEQKLSDSEWTQILTEITLQPKLHRDSLVFIIRRALSLGQSAPVLHYAISGKKEDRNLVQALGPSSLLSGEALMSLKKLKNVDFVNWKVYASQIKWISTLVLDDMARELLQSLITVLQTLERGVFPKVITKTSVKFAARQCIDVLLEARFRAVMLAELNPKNFKKDHAVTLISSLVQFGLEGETQVSLIRAFADADFLDVIGDRRVWSKIDITSIATMCSHKIIFEVLIKNLDFIEEQILSSLRSRNKGIGLIIQLCDQFPDFAKLIDPKFLNSFDVGAKPSSAIFSIVSAKLIQSEVARGSAIRDDLKKIHSAELKSLKELIDTKIIEVETLNLKVANLEKQVVERLSDKLLAKETVLRQARIDALVTVSEIIDEIRILAEEMGQIDAAAVGILYRTALRKIRKFDVRVISATDVARADDRSLFETVGGEELSTIFVNRPAYVLTSGNSEFVLVRGKRLA